MSVKKPASSGTVPAHLEHLRRTPEEIEEIVRDLSARTLQPRTTMRRQNHQAAPRRGSRRAAPVGKHDRADTESSLSDS